MIDITLDLSVLAELDELEEGIDDALEACCDRAAIVVLQQKMREIAQTDKRPIPTKGQVRDYAKSAKAGKPKRVGKKRIGQADPKRSVRDNEPAWSRDGSWKESQRILKPSRFEREIVTEGEAAKREARLAELPTGALGVNRSNPAAQNAQDKVEPQLGPLLEQEVRNVLGL